jgi:hypothetical protein
MGNLKKKIAEKEKIPVLLRISRVSPRMSMWLLAFNQTAITFYRKKPPNLSLMRA